MYFFPLTRDLALNLRINLHRRYTKAAQRAKAQRPCSKGWAQTFKNNLEEEKWPLRPQSQCMNGKKCNSFNRLNKTEKYDPRLLKISI